MLLKIGAVLAAIPLALFALVGATGVLVVDVRESGPDGHHFIVPVPLLLAQAAAGLAPHAGRELDLPRLREYLPMAQEAIEGLSRAPDGELVRVEERDETVLITKVGSTFQVRVNGRDQEVSVNVPLSMAGEVLRSARHGRISAADLVGALRDARFTTLADVRDGRDHVKVTVW